MSNKLYALYFEEFLEFKYNVKVKVDARNLTFTLEVKDIKEFIKESDNGIIQLDEFMFFKTPDKDNYTLIKPLKYIKILF